MSNQEAVALLTVAKAEVEWEYPLDYQLAFDKAIGVLNKWQQLKETITEIKENNKFEKEDVTLMCKFLLNYMEVLENDER